jgi:UDP-N-acetylmuramate--alanine ligase
VISAFTAWLRRAAVSASQPILVANVADAGVEAVVHRLRGWGGRIVATGLAQDGPVGASKRILTLAGSSGEWLAARIVTADADGTVLEMEGSSIAAPLRTRLQLAGRHNAANALGVAGAALALGVSADDVATGLSSFGGVGRRLERKGAPRGIPVYDDYGHHPTAIRETLAAIRQKEPGRRVVAVYEPLTYHRTAAMLEEFAEVLAQADAVAIAQIWSSRDPDTTITSAEALAQAVSRRNPGIVSVAPGSVEETAAWVAENVSSGDAVLVMGGGKSYRIAELLVQALSR